MKIWKALTICQPYAHLIMTGKKRVENRSWPTRYRGPLIIHAGKSRAWLDPDLDGPLPADMPFGAIVGYARLVDCIRREDIRRCQVPAGLEWLATHEHTEGPWCWVLSGAKPCPKPIPYRGKQGLFDIPDDVLAAARGGAS